VPKVYRSRLQISKTWRQAGPLNLLPEPTKPSFIIAAHTMTLPGHSPNGLSPSLRLRSIAFHGIAI